MKNQQISLASIFTIIIFFTLICMPDGVLAQTIKIGKQTWETKNLNVSKFRNGDPIMEANTEEEWENANKAEKPAWCYYLNSTRNGAFFGKLYNWFAVHDSRGLAPAGWHIPSDKEWVRLTNFLGGEKVAGGKMKSTESWVENGNGTNESGFTGLAGGLCYEHGTFDGGSSFTYWWSSTEIDKSQAMSLRLGYDSDEINHSEREKRNGYYVRCLKN
ncbi:MAG TPA: fibrobacter succinogenes major paralogous domain-containing protein [Ferruginibacter sp.]|nr:fibrobacter succinogenes major paralogous domain-containing protein [Ferruginibacter sp.]